MNAYRTSLLALVILADLSPLGPSQALAAEPTADTTTLTSAGPEWICSDRTFIDASGNLQKGTKACAKLDAKPCDGTLKEDCVTSSAFVPVPKIDLKPEWIQKGRTIGGVAGSFDKSTVPTCQSNGQTSCLTTEAYKALSLASVNAADLLPSAQIGGLTGTFNPNPDACTTGAQASCLIQADFFAGRVCTGNDSGCVLPTYQAGSKPLKAISYDALVTALPGIRSSISLGGVTGSLADCAANAAIDCVTTPTYQSASFSNLTATNIVQGYTIGGVAGSMVAQPANCGSPGQQNCLASGTYYAGTNCAANGSGCFLPSYVLTTQPLKAMSFDALNSALASIKNSVTLGGLAGTLVDCSTNGTIGCVATASYVSADLTNLVATNLKNGVSVAGVTGNVVQAPANCSTQGQQSCVVSGSYFAGTNCAANASNCYLPSYVLTTQPLKAISYDSINSNLASLRSSVTLSGLTGTLLDCSTNGAAGCVSTATYKAADWTNLTAPNINSGVTLAGVAGSYANAPANCSAGGQQSCTVTGSYFAGTTCSANGSACYLPTYVLTTQPLKAISFDSVTAGILRSGQSYAGVSGNITLPAVSKVLTGYGYGTLGTELTGTLTLPSAANVLTGSGTYGDASALTTPTFNAKPPAPIISSAAFNGTSGITVTWNASSGATGYIVLMQSSAISWQPTDGQTYTTGTAQGLATIIYSGSATTTTYNFALTNGAPYYLAVYAYQSGNVYSGSSAMSTLVYCGGVSAGGTWVGVPADPAFKTGSFCVMKYVASNNSSSPLSSSSGTPWVNITQTSALTACSGLGTGYHLITNPEWLTTATNIASVGSNWSGGTVGSGMLRRGHSDSNPNSACAANGSDANAYVETNCTGLSTGNFDQRRTSTLTTGGVLWDIGGNVNNWVDRYNATDKPSGGTNWTEYSATTPSTNWPWLTLTPTNTTHGFWQNSWNSTQGIGRVWPGTAASGGVALRGADWDDGANAGAFALFLNEAPSGTNSNLGFRCAWTP